MDWKADWIWLPGDGLEINTRVLFRKTFEVKSFDRAELSVTADSRYRLCVNGRWVSDGPVRSFPWQYAYDRIDVTGHLQPGRNVIAVVVVHHGEGTFHHLVTRGGLLAVRNPAASRRPRRRPSWTHQTTGPSPIARKWAKWFRFVNAPLAPSEVPAKGCS